MRFLHCAFGFGRTDNDGAANRTYYAIYTEKNGGWGIGQRKQNGDSADGSEPADPAGGESEQR